MEHVRVIVIGGGAVGASCLYHLAELGWTDALLLERDELTSGSTWHAAGNCPTFSTNWSLMRLQKYSTDLYRRLAASPGYPINYHVTGSIRLAHHRERMDEFRHVRGMARANGIDYELLSGSEIRARYPFVELHDLEGALWDPLDGDIDPAQLTQALAKAARDRGARILRGTRVTGLAQLAGGEWRVATDRGDHRAEVVVNAAGYRAGEVMALLGRHLPTVVMAHQYLVTEDIQALAARSERLPLLRDPDVSYYLRQERNALLLGPYEWKATPMWQDGIPTDFAHRLFPDDLDRLESYIEDAMRRVPLLAEAGIRRVVNGPIPYSPDGNPYIGPERGPRNFFHCNTFSFGIAQAGGAGKALAEWVVHGAPEWDLWAADRRRYTAYATTAYTLAKAVEVYQNEYAPAFRFEERPAGRPNRTSPLYERLKDQRAHYGARGGWERPLFFDPEGRIAENTLSFRRAHNFLPLVGREIMGVRQGVGVLDLPGFTKMMVSGEGAERFLDRRVCSKLPRVGRVGLAYVLTPAGGVLSELTVTRLAPDRFYLCAAASAEWHDRDVLEAALPDDGSVQLEDLTEAYGTLVLAGPRSRDLLARVAETDVSSSAFPWLAARTIACAGRETLVLRISYVGELGYELHGPIERLPALYEAIRQAGRDVGLIDFGIYAVDHMRLEKCYPAWKTDLETGFSPLDAALDRFVDFSKPEFPGRTALLEQRARGPRWRLVPLVLDEAGEADALALASVFVGKERVGLVTSGTWSFALERSIALAYVRTGLTVPGTMLAVEIFGEMLGARVARAPLFDPENRRLRG